MKTHTQRRKSGFSLAELMVVIVIIGLLATLVVPKVLRSLFVANVGKAKADIAAIAGAIDTYAIENNGRFPESIEALVTPDENGFTFLNQETVPKDPWGQEYQYEPPYPGNPDPRVFTLGEDGAIGGEGPDKDLSNIQILGGEDE